MRVGLFVVYDCKVCNYSMPLFAQSDQAAVRAFSDALKQGDTLMSRHPEDFVLFRIADVDDSNGAVTTPPTPVEVFAGRNLDKEKANVR